MKRNGVMNGSKVYEHLQKFLSISDTNKDLLMIKKLEKAIDEIQAN